MITTQELREVYKLSAFKNGVPEGLFNVFVFRPFSICLSWLLASLAVHPNIISSVAFVTNLTGAFLLFYCYDGFQTVALLCVAGGHILDMCDGEVARLLKKGSRFGAFYDPFLDRMVDVLLPFFVVLGFARSLGGYDLGLITLLGLYLAIRMGSYFVQGVTNDLGAENSVKSLSGKLLSGNVTRYVRWDGGFTVVLYCVCVPINAIVPLIIFLVLFHGSLLVVNLRRVYLRLI